MWAVVAVAVALVAGLAAGVRMERAGARRAAREEARAVDEGLVELQQGQLDLVRQYEQQRAETERARANYDDLLGRVEGIIGERETWRRKYLDAVGSYGAAQNMMITAIQSLCRQVAAAGGRPRLDRGMRAVLDEIQAEGVGSAGADVASAFAGALDAQLQKSVPEQPQQRVAAAGTRQQPG